MKRFFVKTLAMLLVCIFVLSGINFSIFASSGSGDLGDTLVAMNVAISGQIKMLFYFTDVDGVDYYEVKVGENDESPLIVRKANMPTDVKNDKTRYLLEVPLAAAQQTEDIIITPYNDEGVSGRTRTRRVTDYADKIVELDKAADDDTYRSLVKALKSMLNYGAMAQLAFSYNTAELANKGLYYGATNPAYNLPVDALYGVDSYDYKTTDTNKLKIEMASAYLEDVVSIKCYITYDGNYEDLRVTVEGHEDKILQDNTGYYVRINNIPATKFNYRYSIVVTDGTDMVTMKYSVLNFVQTMIEKNADAEDVNAARSMYQFYVWMSEYAGNSVAIKPTICKHDRTYVEPDTYAEICSDCHKDVTPVGLLDNAANLSNGVNAYYTSGDRDGYVVENSNMKFHYPLNSNQSATITDKNGNVYVENTMDVYVKTTSGTYYASNSIKEATANLFRYGYYYYDAHMYGQNFMDEAASDTVTATSNVQLNRFRYGGAVDMSTPTISNNILSTTITSTADPQIYTYANALTVNTATYNALDITMATASTSQVQLRYTTTEDTSYGEEHRIDFSVKADGEFHTYRIFFDESVTVKGLRLDFNGQKGETIQISAVNFVQIKLGSAPALLLDRGLHTYTDKMHQALSLVATADVANITEVGMETKILATNVNGVRVKVLGNEELLTAISSTIENVEYAGFDIDGAGIFGYILPADDQHCGTITITVEGDYYVIRQTIVPEDNKISAQDTLHSSSELATKYPDFKGTSTNIYNSPTQFYFGQRIYTDGNHSFDAFLEEAYIERHPLGSTNITINTDKTPNATFDGYDGIRGMYAFTIPENIGFNAGYYYAQNFHGALSFKITGDEYSRNVYVMAYSYGCSIEGGAVLDKNDNLLPLPTEVSKNFNHEFEVPMYLWGDVGYSETRIPVYVNAGETEELTVLQTYMNWGKYPLKQISSIQFFAPYYHLSTGVTESNCIANYYVMGKDLQTLPDHRAASAPWWSDHETETGDPQHDNGGYHMFLQYTDSNGQMVASESISSVINSSGPTYADIDMTYISDDGKIQVTYTHIEMPQTDENRAYYEMRYKVLEDVTINDFASNFSFYSVAGYGNGYQKFGYYGTSAVNGISADTSARYTLGTNCPYFDLYQIDNVDNEGNQNKQNANVSFLISDYTLPSSLSGSSFIVNVENRKASLSLNAGNVTLNAGEEIVIYAIIMPWGYYDTADDTLVQNVRENTLVAPIVATPGEHAEAVTNKFIPTVKTTNGLDATVTISHANADKVALDSNDNINVTFRVDGFNILTAPKLYKFVNSDWQLVELSSENSVDESGNAHCYDGYAVHYDKDTKTYSYSFVTTVTGEEESSFKVVVDDTYVEWEEQHGDLFYDATLIHGFASDGKALTSTLVNDGEYVTLTNGGTNDPATSSFKIVGGSAAKYIVLKYKLATNTTESGIQFFATTSGTFDGTNDTFTVENSAIKRTGTWQVMIIDLAALVKEKGLTDMVATSAGTYSLSSFRLDPFTSVSNDSIDIEYIAFCRDLNAAVEMNSDMSLSDISYVGSTTSSMPISDKLVTADTYANMNVVFVGNDLAAAMTDTRGDIGITGATVNADGTVTVDFASENNDEYFTVYTNGIATGKYLVMKYKTGEGLTSADGSFWAMAYYNDTTTNTGHVKTYGLKADGEWHTLVIDLTKLGTGVIAADDGKYYVTSFRSDMFDALSANGSVDFEYIGLCDELSDVPSSISAKLEYSAEYKNNIDWAYVDGDTSNDNKNATSVTGTAVNYVGWLGIAGMSVDGISYVVTDAVGNETEFALTASSEYNEGSEDIQNAVASLGTGTVGYTVNFTANLAAWAGQTVKLSVRAIVDGIMVIDTYSINVEVPESADPGLITGKELEGVLSTGKFSGTLNNDGSLTITSTAADGDGALNISSLVAVTPRYALIKYKTINHGAQITVLATTAGNNIGGYVHSTAITDGEWHTILVDLTKCSGYNYGDAVTFLRLDICEGAEGYSITIDHVYLFSDLSDIAGELIETKFANNVDYLYIDGDTANNQKGQTSLTATTVDYTGWLGVDGQTTYGMSYVVTDYEGNETVVALANKESGTNIYYKGDQNIQNAVTGDGWSTATVGYVVKISADLSAWAGETVTLSIRETIYGGAVVETFSITVSVPSDSFVEQDTLDVIFEGQDLVDMMTDNAGNHGDLGVTGAVLNADGTVTVKYNDSGDRYFSFELDGTMPTGQYLVVKYRTGLGVNVANNGSVNCLASTADDRAWTGHSKLVTIVSDHKWHTLVIDLSDLASVTDSTGSYYITLLRADFFDALTANGSVDFAYVGLCDDLGDVALGDNEYLEYGWQNWTASLDSITIDGASAAHDSAANTHLQGSAGASDRNNSYTGGNWAWSGWFAVDGQNVTDISVCVTDEAGVEHWISFGTPAGRSDLNTEGSMHAETNLGYATGTLCYKAAVSADLGAYAGQTVSVSVRVITESGSAVTLYSVFVTVPKSAAPHWVSGAELEGYLRDGIHTGELNGDGSLTITAAQDDNAGSQFTNSFHGEFAGMTAPKYAVLRYKTTTETSIGIYARTTSSTGYKYIGTTIKNDGMWHTIIIDLATEQYVVGEEITYFRIDTCWVKDNAITIDYIYLCNEEGLPEFHRADFINGDELSGFVRTDCYDHVLNDDGTLTITGKTAGDNYFNGFQSLMSGLPATKYAVVRYKTTTETSLTILASTGANAAGPYTATSLINDGFWHIAVLDLTACSGYVVGDTFSFMRINTCKTVGSSITFDYIVLCDDLTGLTVTPPSSQYRNNVDYLYVNNDTSANLKGSATISGTSVQYTGWLAVNDCAITNVSYAIIDANGNETIVSCDWNLNRSDISTHVQTSAGFTTNTVGCGGNMSVDLSKWAGQTVVFSIRATTSAGYIAETFSVAVTVPAA
ncbi:MAG: hypothetical protein IJ345_05900 [Clostridia bacterium]|nr:hypothetical protein [Clostridia bacterium]